MMDIYESGLKYFSTLKTVDRWPELQQGFERMAAKKPRGWELPVTAYEKVGGFSDSVIPAVVAFGCMQMSIILIDDMLDEDPRGMHNNIGEAQTANLATAYHAAGQQAIAQSDADETVKLYAQARINFMMLKTGLGQMMDIQNPQSEEGYWTMVQTKSSPFYSAALYVGALYGNANDELSNQIKLFGNLYGEMIQIHDDLGDTMARPAGPDWIQRRFPLPILFAHVVDHPDRDRFLELRENAADPTALEEAQLILIRCGAVSYCLEQVVERYRTMKMLLDEMDVIDNTGFEYLLYELVHPIIELVLDIGAELPAELQAIDREKALINRGEL